MSGQVDKEFFSNFRSQLQGLKDRLSVLQPDESRDSLVKSLDTLTEDAAALSKYLTDSTPFLPPYDVRSSQTALAEFRRNLDAKRAELVPKKKFTFKGRRQRGNGQHAKTDTSKAANDSGDALTDAGDQSHAKPRTTEDTEEKQQQQQQQEEEEEETLGFSDRKQATLTLKREQATNSDVTLKNLDGCTVLLEGAPGAIHASNLTNTTVCIGPVSRSLLIDRCTGCRFVLACQQLRVHNTYDTDFYLHVTSRAIIEDCDRVRFAPYNWAYAGIDSDYEAAGLNRGVNYWDKVNDFKWIKPHEPSPHWTSIPQQDRIQEWPTIAGTQHDTTPEEATS